MLAEGLAWWLKRDEWMLLVRFLVVLGALSCVPTVVLGWPADYPIAERQRTRTSLSLSPVLGTATSAWAVVCAVLVCIAECEEGSMARRRFRGALLLGAFLIASGRLPRRRAERGRACITISSERGPASEFKRTHVACNLGLCAFTLLSTRGAWLPIFPAA